MKLYSLSIFVTILLFVIEINQTKQLSLLKAKENFKVSILDPAINDSIDPYEIVMLRVEKKPGMKNAEKESESYEMRIITLPSNVFKFFRLNDDKYFGYFQYKGRYVLVYGDDNIGYFFSKTKILKQFNFLPDKPYDYNKYPPVIIEPNVFLYNFLNGQFTKVD